MRKNVAPRASETTRRITAIKVYSWSKMAKFTEHEVVPDVLSAAPASVAEVVWPSGAKAEQGNVLTPTQIQDPPTVTWAAEDGAFYTIIMTDPDAPSRKEPKYREWRHWVVVNIPGGDVSKGEVCAEYVGAGPPKGTGLHRYVVLVYKQPGRLDYTDTKLGLTMKGRPSTKANDLAAKYNLGNPIAGNFCQAEWDDYVPKLYEKLSS